MPIDFEEMNRQLSTGEYHRDSSYFEGTELMPRPDLPEGQELQILETVRDKVPRRGLHDAVQNPVGGNPEAVRDNLREAARLLKEAGIRDPRPQAGRSRRQAGQRRIPVQRSG